MIFKIPICTVCVGSTHCAPAHQYEILEHVESKNVEELEVLMMRAKEKINECSNEFSQTLDKYLSDLQEQSEQSKEAVNETHQSYKRILAKRKDDIIKELEEKHSAKELLIMDMHNNIEQSMTQINDLTQFVQRCLLNGNCSEILLMKNLIVNQLRFLMENLPTMYSVDVNLKFNSDQEQFEKAIRENFGRFSTDKEIKQQMLNHLTSEKQLNQQQQTSNTFITKQQMQQLQKQLEMQQHIQQQEWIFANMMKNQQGQNMNRNFNGFQANQQIACEETQIQQQQNVRRPPSRTSPHAALTDDWFRNSKPIVRNTL